MKVLIGTTVIRKYAFVLDKFLENQKNIQNNFIGSELVIVTDEINFLEELRNYFIRYNLKGEVVYYKIQKPDYAKDRIWSITCGREAIRQFAIKNKPDYLLSVDADMIFDNSLIQIFLGISNGFDVVQSGYKGRATDNIGFGLSCTLISKDIFEKLVFRCKEFKNGQLICDGDMFEYDAFRKGAKIKKGIFVEIEHYVDTKKKIAIKPYNLTLQKRLLVSPAMRYLMVASSLCLRYDLGSLLQKVIYREVRKELK